MQIINSINHTEADRLIEDPYLSPLLQTHSSSLIPALQHTTCFGLSFSSAASSGSYRSYVSIFLDHIPLTAPASNSSRRSLEFLQVTSARETSWLSPSFYPSSLPRIHSPSRILTSVPDCCLWLLLTLCHYS